MSTIPNIPESLGAENAEEKSNQQTEAPAGENAGAETSAEAPKRRRGRPRKDGSTAPNPTKPGGDKVPPKGRPRKSYGTDAVSNLARQLVGIHQLSAMATGFHELAITDNEGIMLAGSVIAVCEEYGFELSGKTGAALQLLGTAAIIYVPKAAMIYARMNAEPAPKQPGTVIDVQGQVVA